MNEQDLRENLKFFRVPEAIVESIRSKLAMRIFHEYTNILKCMYSTRFNGCSAMSGTSLAAQSTLNAATPSLISTLETSLPDKYREQKKGSKEVSDN